MEIVIEIVIAALSVIVGIVASDAQNKASEGRSSKENRIRSLYQAVKNRFGITQQQLSQYAEQLDIRLNQLTESTRGSARLSRASKILREFIAQYPEMKGKINKATNIIQNEISNLDSKEASKASDIQNRRTVTNQNVLEDVVPSINVVNDAVGVVNKGQNAASDRNKTTEIDTSLIDHIKQSPEEKEIDLEKVRNELTAWRRSGFRDAKSREAIESLKTKIFNKGN